MRNKNRFHKFLSSRRATFSVLLILFITLAGGIVLFMVGYKVTIYLKAADVDERCKLSFLAASEMQEIKRETATFVDAVPTVDCPAKVKEITLKEVSKNGRINDNKMKKIYADELKRCWDMVGAGRNNPTGVITGTDKSACMICSKIFLSDKLREKVADQNYELKNLNFYLATQPVAGTTKTYYEYLYNKRVSDDPAFIRTLKNANDVYPLDEVLYATWRYRLDVDFGAKYGSQLVALLTSSLLSSYGTFDDFETCSNLLNG